MKKVIEILCINLLFLSFAKAQTPQAQPAEGNAADKAAAFFNKSIHKQSRLFNGPAFENYGSDVDGSANFQELTNFTNGKVVYDGFEYNDVPMMYDLYEDKVVSYLINKLSTYTLVSERVSEFYINNHQFKYINVIDTNTSIIKPGFFEVLYNGESKIFAKWTKKIQISVKDDKIRYYFIPKTTYYLKREETYYPVNNEKSFLSFFKDKKNELKKHLKANKIKFKKEPAAAMILLVNYYESLPKN